MRYFLLATILILSTAMASMAQGYGKLTVSNITINGNKKTKPEIIKCEMGISIGDTITEEELPQIMETCKNNLHKTSLFNYVTITNDQDTINQSVSLNVKVEERWYIWPEINITPHNGNLNDWLHNPDLDLVDYCIGIKKYNFRGRRESLYIMLRRGFNNITQFGYQNIAIDKRRQHLLAFMAEIKRQKSLVLTTTNNQALYREFAKEKNAISSYLYQATYTYRPTINIRNHFTAGYFLASISDSVAILNPNYLGRGRKHAEGAYLQYEFCINNRNSNYYPLTGSYLSTSITKRGLFSNSIDTYKISLDARKYWQIDDRQYFSSMLYASSSSNTMPFCYLEAIGFKPHIVAGYEYDMIAGEKLSYLKTSYKFQLLKQHILHLKRINIPKFNKIHYAVYLNAFANAGYVSPNSSDDANNNNMNDTFLGAIGVGLDIVTYYDRVLTTYVTRNIQGHTYFGIGFRSSF